MSIVGPLESTTRTPSQQMHDNPTTPTGLIAYTSIVVYLYGILMYKRRRCLNWIAIATAPQEVVRWGIREWLWQLLTGLKC
jgi:hypothetical protein